MKLNVKHVRCYTRFGGLFQAKASTETFSNICCKQAELENIIIIFVFVLYFIYIYILLMYSTVAVPTCLYYFTSMFILYQKITNLKFSKIWSIRCLILRLLYGFENI